MRGQLREYLLAFDLDERRGHRRARRDLFQKWLVEEQNEKQDVAESLGKELEEDLWTLQDGGPKLWRFIFSSLLIISLLLSGAIWIIGSNEFAGLVGLYGIACLALGGLAAFARFSDLFHKSHTDRLRVLIGLSRNDLIGLLGTAGIVATSAASYFKFTHLAYRVAADNQEIITVLKAILKKLP